MDYLTGQKLILVTQFRLTGCQNWNSTTSLTQFFSLSDNLCLTLSDAIMNGKQEQALEIVKKMVSHKLYLSIKLKNPTLVTMDCGGNTIT